jgi:hypothetical protein
MATASNAGLWWLVHTARVGCAVIWPDESKMLCDSADLGSCDWPLRVGADGLFANGTLQCAACDCEGGVGLSGVASVVACDKWVKVGECRVEVA